MRRQSLVNITMHSRFVHFARPITDNSRIVMFGGAIVRVTLMILNKSKTIGFFRKYIWPMLLVENRLERNQSIDSSILRSSVSWAKLNKLFGAITRYISTIRVKLRLSHSAFISRLLTPSQSGTISARKRAMQLFLIFVGMYYSIRFVLLMLIPAADIHTGLGAGFFLGFLLYALVVVTERR